MEEPITGRPTMNNEIVIARPSTDTLEKQAQVFIARAEEMQITTVEHHETALEVIRDLRKQEKAITEHFEPSRKAADNAKKSILESRDILVKPLAEARGILSNKAVAYQQEQIRIEAEARKKAEEEARIAQEKIDEEARRIEAERQKEFDAAIEAGDEAKAEEILEEEPVEVEEVRPVKVEAPRVAQVSGSSTRTTWSAEVIDLTALIVYVTMNIGERSKLLEPCMKELNKIAVAEKGGMEIPGVQAVSNTTVVTR